MGTAIGVVYLFKRTSWLCSSPHFFKVPRYSYCSIYSTCKQKEGSVRGYIIDEVQGGVRSEPSSYEGLAWYCVSGFYLVSNTNHKWSIIDPCCQCFTKSMIGVVLIHFFSCRWRTICQLPYSQWDARAGSLRNVANDADQREARKNLE